MKIAARDTNFHTFGPDCILVDHAPVNVKALGSKPTCAGLVDEASCAVKPKTVKNAGNDQKSLLTI